MIKKIFIQTVLNRLKHEEKRKEKEKNPIMITTPLPPKNHRAPPEIYNDLTETFLVKLPIMDFVLGPSFSKHTMCFMAYEMNIFTSKYFVRKTCLDNFS